MDHAVALVEAYLRVNGYLTVAEYPVLDAPRHGPVQTLGGQDRGPRAGDHDPGLGDFLVKANAALEVVGSELPGCCRQHVAPAG